MRHYAGRNIITIYIHMYIYYFIRITEAIHLMLKRKVALTYQLGTFIQNIA